MKNELTFDRALEVFRPYLQEDTYYEVVSTSRGYTIMEWDDSMHEWVSATLCETPEELKECLLDSVKGYIEFKNYLNHEESKETVQEQVAASQQYYLFQFEENKRKPSPNMQNV